jgi:hypothetical protein
MKLQPNTLVAVLPIGPAPRGRYVLACDLALPPIEWFPNLTCTIIHRWQDWNNRRAALTNTSLGTADHGGFHTCNSLDMGFPDENRCKSSPGCGVKHFAHQRQKTKRAKGRLLRYLRQLARFTRHGGGKRWTRGSTMAIRADLSMNMPCMPPVPCTGITTCAVIPGGAIVS